MVVRANSALAAVSARDDLGISENADYYAGLGTNAGHALVETIKLGGIPSGDLGLLLFGNTLKDLF